MKLQLTTTAWFLFGATVLLWGFSVLWAGSRHERSALKWRAIPLSIFGFAWAGFGVDFILRFLVLGYDPVLFRATQYPLWLLPAGELSRTWFYLGVYWLAFCVAAAIDLLADRHR